MKKRTTQIVKLQYFFLVGLFILSAACENKEQRQKVEVLSPNGSYALIFQIDEKVGPTYKLTYKNTEVIHTSRMGLELSGVEVSNDNLRIGRTESQSISTSWKPLYGERNEYPEIYKEEFISLKNSPYDVRIRAYNEGVAFRYEFSEGEVNINRELTEFSFSKPVTVWASVLPQSEIDEVHVKEVTEASERPMLIKHHNKLYLAIGEAAQIDHSQMKLIARGDRGLQVALEGEVNAKGPFVTPWRFVMAGETAGSILENNYLILNLNEPSKLKDHSWIQPGKVIRDLTLTTTGAKSYIDFAAKHNLQYVIESAGWYGDEFTKEADATTVTVDPKRSTGPLDMQEVIRYGKEKGIDIMVYVNRNQLEKQLDQILPLYQEWGIKGIKYGFVRTGDQNSTRWLHEAVRKAADHKMVLSIHDDYRPVGYTRTYPNLMTQEGIRGDEESPSNSHTLRTMFTRMIAGAGDNTVCYFDSRVTEKMGSHASQLAKTVCIYSPLLWLYWYDRPESAGNIGGAGDEKPIIREVPELKFFDKVPTVWDETRVIHSQVGELGTIARKNGTEWFVGTINGVSEKEITIPLDFLDEGKEYTAALYFDDPSVNTVTHVGIKNMVVNNTSVIKQNVKENNGLAIHIFEN